MTADAMAPEFPATLRWLDRPAPLRLWQALRGEVVAILFWRLGCVHGRQALRDFAGLAAEFAGTGVTLVAIHVPALAAEREEWRVRAQVRRLPSVLPAAIDPEGHARAAFGAAGHPALVLIDADGSIRFRGRGEPDLPRLRSALQHLLAAAHTRSLTPPLPFRPWAWLDDAAERAAVLRQPGGLAVDALGRLWVADTGNHRLLVVEPTGRVVRVIGHGSAGLVDGEPGMARFQAPTGLLWHAGRMLVADTGNHCLRAIEPDNGFVRTVCGTGQRSIDRFGGGFGDRQGLCSPVGLAAAAGGVYVAQAGAHQLWQFDPDTQSASAWLGTGVADRRDGDEAATLAQPHGLCSDGFSLWVADAGSGAVRAVDLAHGRIRTLATGMPRPVAVAVGADRLWVADPWRGAVLALPRDGGEPETIADAASGLRAPTALAVAGERLWIADAGTGSLWCLAPGDPGAVPVALPLADVPAARRGPAGGSLRARAITVRAFADVTVDLAVPLPADAQPDATAPIAIDLVDEDGATLAVARHGSGEFVDGRLRVTNVAIAEPGVGIWRVRAQFGLRSGPTAEPERCVWHAVVPVRAAEGGPLAATIGAAGPA